MSWKVVPLDALDPQPWKNGGGTTRELLAWPARGKWVGRVSVAEVAANGPFSAYEGRERWFAVLEGAGVVLDVGGGRHWLHAGDEPFHFDGGVPVACRLVDGPTLDFNLMAPPGRSRLRRLQDREQLFKMRGPGLLGVYAHTQPARVALDGIPLEVAPRQLAWCDLRVASSGSALGADALLVEVRA